VEAAKVYLLPLFDTCSSAAVIAIPGSKSSFMMDKLSSLKFEPTAYNFEFGDVGSEMDDSE
jgi:hypothetical protein